MTIYTNPTPEFSVDVNKTDCIIVRYDNFTFFYYNTSFGEWFGQWDMLIFFENDKTYQSPVFDCQNLAQALTDAENFAKSFLAD